MSSLEVAKRDGPVVCHSCYLCLLDAFACLVLTSAWYVGGALILDHKQDINMKMEAYLSIRPRQLRLHHMLMYVILLHAN